MSDMPDARPQGKDTAKEEGGRPATIPARKGKGDGLTREDGLVGLRKPIATSPASLTKISVRGVDAGVYNQFRVAALRARIKTGEALTQALDLWLDQPEP